MTELEAKQAGVRAFQAGKSRAAAQNKEFIGLLFATKQTSVKHLLTAFLHGWDVANLAADAPLPDMPSVLELQEILNPSG